MPKKAKKQEEAKETENKENSKKPELSQSEYEKKVIELAENGLTSEKIGEVLRKQGIHPKEYNKKISKILGEKYINPDLKNIGNKLDKIKKHHEKNKQDKRAMREKDRIFSQLRKLKQYYKVD